MKKRGFTLIEIIICITLITVIGVGSFVGVKLVNDKIKITKLEQITDKAVEAAQVYLETNKEAYNQLYSNSNGVSLPLKLLVNEGLLNIDNTDLTINDLKDEYVVTFLGGSGSSDNCEQITSSTSWANDKPLYLCMNSTGGSNLATIDPTKYGNLTTVMNEPYYFKGNDPDNYVILKENNGIGPGTLTARIYKIDRDDSIAIYTRSTDLSQYISLETNNLKKYDNAWYKSIGVSDICNTLYNCRYITTYGSWMYINMINDPYYADNPYYTAYDRQVPMHEDKEYGSYITSIAINSHHRIYFLQPCWKIIGGTGAYESPFEIKCS